MKGLRNIPAARPTDPTTSHKAVAEINKSGLRQKQAQHILALVGLYPGATSTEMCGGDFVLFTVARRRLPELELIGLVRRGPARICKIAGRSLLTWWPAGVLQVAAAPSPVVRAKRIKQLSLFDLPARKAK